MGINPISCIYANDARADVACAAAADDATLNFNFGFIYRGCGRLARKSQCQCLNLAKATPLGAKFTLQLCETWRATSVASFTQVLRPPLPFPFHHQVNMQKTNKSNNCSTQTHANAPPEMHTLAQAHAHSHAHPGKCIKIKQTALVTGNKKDSSNNSNNGSPAAITTATAHKRFLTRALEKGYLFQ